MTGRLVGTARTFVAAVAALGLLGGCVQAVDGTPGVADAQLDVVGDSGDAFDTSAKNALADIETFWRQEYPKVADGAALPKLRGQLYSVDGLQVAQTRKLPEAVAGNACLKREKLFIVDNAAYCQLDDSILWDRSPEHLVPKLASTYGDAVTALVFAHEFGHAIQQRVGIPANTPTIYTESQADCAAGAFVAYAMAGNAPHFPIDAAGLDQALIGFLQIRDSTPESPQDISHGNGFDRVAALQAGIANGATYCFSSDYFDTRRFTEVGYVPGSIDQQQNGNLPIQQMLTNKGIMIPDMNRFWTDAGDTVSRTFEPVKIAEAGRPKCADAGTSAQFGYCTDDNTIYYSKDFANAAYNSLAAIDPQKGTGNIRIVTDLPADYSLGVLFAIGFGLAARHQFFDGSQDDAKALLAAICYAGAYTADVNPATNTDIGADRKFVLSPPDMDEATSSVLILVGRPDAFGERGTTGLTRVTAFVTGYTKGLQGCS